MRPRILVVAGWGYHASDLQAFASLFSNCEARTTSCAELVPRDGVPATGYPYAEALTGMVRARGPFAAVVGWSMGGLAALEMVASGIAPVERLVLVASTARFCATKGYPFGFGHEGLSEFSRSLGPAFDESTGRFVRDVFRPDAVTDEVMSLRQKVMRSIGVEELRRGLSYLEATDLRDRLERVRCPVLAIHGKEDRVIPWQAGQFVALRVADGRMDLIEGAGHNVIQSHGVVVRDMVERFIS